MPCGEVKESTQVQGPQLQPMLAVWQGTGLFAEIRIMQDMLSGARAQRCHPGREEGKLVIWRFNECE